MRSLVWVCAVSICYKVFLSGRGLPAMIKNMASDHNYFSITFRTKTSWEKIADNFAIDAYFLLLMSSFLTFKFIHFTHDHDQLLFLLSSVKVNTCQFIPVTAHVGSLLRGVLRFTCFPKIKRKQNKLLIFKTPTC